MNETSRPEIRPIATQFLSVKAEDAQIIDIPFPILKRIFDKAVVILSSKSSYVIKMPTSSNDRPTFLVHSTSSENPHKVEAFPESGKVSCDQSCTGWKLYSLCSHTVTVAETLKLSKAFLKWFKKKRILLTLQRLRTSTCHRIKAVNVVQGKERVRQTSSPSKV